MLRISQNSTANGQRWILSGQLTGPWVAELRAAWQRAQSEPHGARIVDLSDVTAIDDRGEELLRAMKEDGAQFVARGVDMRHILHHLDRKGKRVLRRFLAHMSDCP